MLTVLRPADFLCLLFVALAGRTDGPTTPPATPDLGANASLNGRCRSPPTTRGTPPWIGRPWTRTPTP